MKNKKVVITITSIVAVLLLIIGVTYAYWLVTKTQTNQNVISSGCLDITISGEKNDIELQDQFPLSDEDGMKLTPYEFTVTNNCSPSVDYQVNLESIGDSTNAIKASAIKVALNDEIKLLTAGGNTEPTLSEAYESNMILYGTLAGSSEETTDDTITYELRIWIDANAPISEQNKSFTSKISVTVGQGIFNPYKEGTLAYDILSNYEGIEEIQTLSALWSEGTYSSSKDVAMSKTVQYYWGTEMNFNESDGTYILGGTVVQATTQECRDGKKSDGTEIRCLYTLKDSTNVDKASRIGYKVTELTSTSKSDTAYLLYVTAQETGAVTNEFSSITSTTDAGLHKLQDDLGPSFYFRGVPTNNYVKFGKWSKATSLTTCKVYSDGYCSSTETINVQENADMYWRIVRINGDGTIRMIYDGTEPVANGVAHTATIGMYDYNASAYDDKYGVGYMYGNEENPYMNMYDSPIKSVIDDWYLNNLKNNYGKYIADAIYCNDRAETSSDSSFTYYDPYSRLNQNKNPKLTCTRDEDKLSISNNYLTYPVGLITVDEASLAGGVNSLDNMTYYLYSGEQYWTMSPHSKSMSYMIMWNIGHNGALQEGGYSFDYNVGYQMAVRPVINLKADVKFTGDGRIDTNTPYEIVMN